MATPLTDQINALTTYANTVTGTSDTNLSDAVQTLANGYGGGGGTKTYIIKDGAIQSGYSFSVFNCTIEQRDGYLYVNGTSNNQYQAIYTPTIDVPSGAYYVVMELVEVNGYYGWTWTDSGASYALLTVGSYSQNANALTNRTKLETRTGYIRSQKLACGFCQAQTQCSVKMTPVGDAGHKGYLNIKDLYFVS